MEQQVPAEPNQRKQQIYMDGRTWTADSPVLLTRTLDAWYQFSELAGLCENPDKTQLTFASDQQKRMLQRHLGPGHELQSKICKQASVLG